MLYPLWFPWLLHFGHAGGTVLRKIPSAVYSNSFEYSPNIESRLSFCGVVKLLGVIRKIKNYDVIELYIRNETETAK